MAGSRCSVGSADVVITSTRLMKRSSVPARPAPVAFQLNPTSMTLSIQPLSSAGMSFHQMGVTSTRRSAHSIMSW